MRVEFGRSLKRMSGVLSTAGMLMRPVYDPNSELGFKWKDDITGEIRDPKPEDVLLYVNDSNHDEIYAAVAKNIAYVASHKRVLHECPVCKRQVTMIKCLTEDKKVYHACVCSHTW